MLGRHTIISRSLNLPPHELTGITIKKAKKRDEMEGKEEETENERNKKLKRKEKIM
jgi:hypothetical protein